VKSVAQLESINAKNDSVKICLFIGFSFLVK